MKFILLPLILNSSVLATHQGIPHNLATDTIETETTEIEDTEPQDQQQQTEEEILFENQIYDAIMDEYYLPWEDESQNEEVPIVEEEDNSFVVDQDFVYMSGDEITMDGNGNAYQTSSTNTSMLQTSFGMMLLDMNMCAIEIIYKYNLTEAVKETKHHVIEQNFIHNLKSARNETKVREIMSEAISPLTMQLMNANGSDLVRTMPDEVVNWMAETAILWAEENNVTDNSTDWFFEEPEVCPEPVTIYEEVIVEQEVLVEVPCPQVICASCPLVQCPVPTACPIIDCPVPIIEPCPVVDCPEPEPFIIYEEVEAECVCEECEVCEDCLLFNEGWNLTESEIPVQVEQPEFEDREFEDDEEYYIEEEEEEEYDPKAESRAYSCDSTYENCRTSKRDRSTSTDDENYNLYYKAYGYYTDYGYFSNYYDYDYDYDYDYYDYYDNYYYYDMYDDSYFSYYYYDSYAYDPSYYDYNFSSYYYYYTDYDYYSYFYDTDYYYDFYSDSYWSYYYYNF